MPCPSETPPPFQTNRPWNNWSGEQPYVIDRYYQPTSIEELVWVVAQAEADGVRLKAVGSGWSFEDIAVSNDWVVDLTRLNAVLGDTVINASSLNETWRGNDNLVHVEAGITIWDLNERLDAMGKAMPSLGGSGGQTLAGATSTSTHGGDFEYGPIHDRIRAIHLVSRDGQEYWIERESAPITGWPLVEPVAPPALGEALSCDDIEIRYDDDLFLAVLVACGRFGVVYSFVVEVVQEFTLRETVERMTWSDVRNGLLGLTTVDNPLVRAPREAPARFVDILMTPHTRPEEEVFVRRRWETTETADAMPTPDPFNILCSFSNIGFILAAVIAGLSAAIGVTAGFPIIGPFLAIPLIIALGTVVALVPASGMTLGGVIATVINVVNGVGQGELVRRLIPEVFGSQLNEQGRTLPSHILMTGTDDQEAYTRCFRVNSLEAIFPEEAKGYVRFIDALQVQAVGRAARSMIIPGYLSLRFSKPSEAMLSMHSFDTGLAVSIEIAVLQGVAGNDAWMAVAEQLALEHGGILHWGQHNTLIAAQVEAFYRDRLQRWRARLGELVADSMTFSNAYTLRRGLEPPGIEPPIVFDCTEQRIQDTDTCTRTEDQGYERCSQTADQGHNRCVAEADQGYNSCAARADRGYNSCCTWWPCSWLCSAFVWISNIVCIAWTWVSNIVCIASTWISNIVCVVSTWVSKIVCVAWAWITLTVCQIRGPRR